MTIGGAENVIDIKDIVAFFIVVAIVSTRFAWFGEHSPRIQGGVVQKPMVAFLVSAMETFCQGEERLYSSKGH